MKRRMNKPHESPDCYCLACQAYYVAAFSKLRMDVYYVPLQVSYIGPYELKESE